jgi:hypothetical protein
MPRAPVLLVIEKTVYDLQKDGVVITLTDEPLVIPIPTKDLAVPVGTVYARYLREHPDVAPLRDPVMFAAFKKTRAEARAFLRKHRARPSFQLKKKN